MTFTIYSNLDLGISPGDTQVLTPDTWHPTPGWLTPDTWHLGDQHLDTLHLGDTWVTNTGDWHPDTQVTLRCRHLLTPRWLTPRHPGDTQVTQVTDTWTPDTQVTLRRRHPDTQVTPRWLTPGHTTPRCHSGVDTRTPDTQVSTPTDTWEVTWHPGVDTYWHLNTQVSTPGVTWSPSIYGRCRHLKCYSIPDSNKDRRIMWPPIGTFRSAV